MRRSIALACVALAGVAAFVPLQLLEADTAWLAFAGVAVIVTLALVVFAIVWKSAIGAAITAAFVAAALVLLTHDTDGLREQIRWTAYAAQAKAAVRAMPPQPSGQLQHVVWDAWGWAGMDTSVYLVYDPANALPKKLPCPVTSIQRLEPNWYSVRFYTSEDWTNCHP
jgi:hypothetical protein